MRTFVDNAGRTWTVTVNVDAIKRVRDLCGVNLLEVLDGKLIERLTGDPILLCDVLYALCKPEADARSISDEEFGRGMAGDAIEAGTTALLEDLVAFFPKGRRAVLEKALRKLQQLETAALNLVSARLESPELERELQKQLLGLSGNVPASLGSTPVSSPSASSSA